MRRCPKCKCETVADDGYCAGHCREKTMIANPEIIEQRCYVIRVYRRTSSKKYFYTVSKDAIQTQHSEDLDSEPAVFVRC